MITDAQFVAWLSQEHANRVVLYEQDYLYEDSGGPTLGTLFLSDLPYLPIGDLPYVDCIASVPEFTRSLGGNQLNTYSSSIGSVEITNTDGELDFLLDLAIDGSEARFYLGDASWARADFRLIFTVLGIRVQRAPFRRLTIDLKDSTALLNQSVGGTTLVGGVGPFANNARPLNVGFVHNITPLSLDSINLTYVHSDSIFATAIEVRDDGIPVTYTDNADGTFELDAAPAGLITCDVDSITGVGQRNVSDAMERIVGARGGFSGTAGLYFGPHATFVEDDVDDYPIGISIQDARNILEILGELTESGNCFSAIRRDGMFTYGRLRPYDIAGLGGSAGIEPVNIVEDDIVPRTAFELEHAMPEYYQYQAYAHKNWTVQSTLSDLLNPDEKARFERKGQYALQNLTGGTAYADAPELYHKTLTVSPPIETLISDADDADIVALTQWMETRRAMFLPWLEIGTVSLPLGANPDDPAMFYALELGDVVRVTIPRFGFDAGTLFQVISIGINLSKARTALRIVRKRGAVAPLISWESSAQYILQTPLQYRLGTEPPTIVPVVTVPPIGPPPGSGGGPPPIIIVRPRPGVTPSVPALYYMDLFSEASVDLTAHLPDIGSAYAVDPDFTDTDELLIADDSLTAITVSQFIATLAAYGIAPISPTSADYFIEAKFFWEGPVEGETFDNIYLLARKNNDTCFILRIGLAQGVTSYEYAQIAIVRFVSGSPAATFGVDNDVSLASSASHIIRWSLIGSTNKIWIDGTLIVDEDDPGVPGAGDEVGFGIEHDPTSGTYFDTVKIDWIVCGTHDGPPEFQLYSAGLTLGPDISGTRTIYYPSTGMYPFVLYLVNHDQEALYELGWTGSITGVTLTTPFAPGANFVSGTIDADTEHPLGSSLSITVFKDSVPLSPIIDILPV